MSLNFEVGCTNAGGSGQYLIFGPLLFLCSLIPKICGQFVPPGNCLPMQKQFDKLNLTGCALHWCGVPPHQILSHRDTKSSRSTLFSALCALQYHVLHILICIYSLQYSAICVCAHCAYCSIVYILHYIFIAISCTLEVGQAHSATVQYWCSIIYTFYCSSQN